jgi:hypothetical protein
MISVLSLGLIQHALYSEIIHANAGFYCQAPADRSDVPIADTWQADMLNLA